MKQIILERNVEYSLFENLIFATMFLTALFVGTTFFSNGAVANFLSFLSAFLLSVCLISLVMKKGLVVNNKLYRGYFLLGLLVFKKEILSPASENFTLLSKQYRQKYIRDPKEADWSYSVNSYELFFFDEDGAIQNQIVKCMKLENCERAKKFLIENASLKFKLLR